LEIIKRQEGGRGEEKVQSNVKKVAGKVIIVSN